MTKDQELIDSTLTEGVKFSYRDIKSNEDVMHVLDQLHLAMKKIGGDTMQSSHLVKDASKDLKVRLGWRKP